MRRRRHSLALALPMLVLGAFACTDAALDLGPSNADAGPGNVPAPPSASGTTGPTSTAPPKGARGNLRDSDSTQGYYRDSANAPYELFNWLVQFDLHVG